MKFNTTFIAGAVCAGLFAFSNSADATIVELDTSLGKVRINLYDDITPNTVENFLAYVTAGDYDNTVIHHATETFTQLGGYRYETGGNLPHVDVRDPVAGEAMLSNVRYTIAMAKAGTTTDIDTSEFVFNQVDNSANSLVSISVVV
ncbi:MAG: peptidylprolyl isomerase, partial [Psychrosphaera sp.]|nr:peptidylprolyl isomerase [Psychrosphaera sp.]